MIDDMPLQLSLTREPISRRYFRKWSVPLLNQTIAQYKSPYRINSYCCLLCLRGKRHGIHVVDDASFGFRKTRAIVRNRFWLCTKDASTNWETNNNDFTNVVCTPKFMAGIWFCVCLLNICSFLDFNTLPLSLAKFFWSVDASWKINKSVSVVEHLIVHTHVRKCTKNFKKC